VSYLPTPLVKGDRIFLCSEQGIATCLEAATGKQLWQERLNGAYSASPVCVGDNIYCVSNDGDVTVFKAADQFQLLGRSSLGEGTQSTPAIAGGRMFFRTSSRLMCLGGKK
jgi:outer membrane protein assembly factor BamB